MKLQHALRRHHGKQKRAALTAGIANYGGSPDSLAWFDPMETDRVLEGYVRRYGAAINGHTILRVPSDVSVGRRSWADLRVAATDLCPNESRSNDSIFIMFNERWYVGVAMMRLSHLSVNLVSFALADGEVAAAFSADWAAGLILDVTVDDSGRMGGEIFVWGQQPLLEVHGL